MIDGDRAYVQSELDAVADLVRLSLPGLGLPEHASVLFRPWSGYFGLTHEALHAVFVPLGGAGMPGLGWFGLISGRRN